MTSIISEKSNLAILSGKDMVYRKIDNVNIIDRIYKVIEKRDGITIYEMSKKTYINGAISGMNNSEYLYNVIGNISTEKDAVNTSILILENNGFQLIS